MAQTKIGSVFSFPVGKKFGYIQYLGSHRTYGDAIRVAVRPRRPVEPLSEDIFEPSYVTFYALRTAARQKLITYRGIIAAPPLPARLRREGIAFGNRIAPWTIESDNGQEQILSRPLTSEEALIPIAEVWNHAQLVWMVRRGLLPGTDGERESEPGGDEKCAATGSTIDNDVTFYAYYKSKSDARAARERLRESETELRCRIIPSGSRWLLRMRAELKDGPARSRLERRLRKIITESGGELDGSETRI